jgi:hypothetical protein
MRLLPQFATLRGVASHRGSGTKGEGKMRLTSDWVKVLAGALTLLALAVHALAG